MQPDDLPKRVALRYLMGSYFEIGQIVYFGKYKNTKGTIIGFSKDERGNPVVEIQPDSGGKTKLLKLYTIWRGDVKR